jgi:hypothetical protein
MSKCGIQWQRTSGHLFDVWHKKEVMPPGIALATGIAVHNGVERNMAAKHDTGEAAPREAVLAHTADRFETEWAGGLFLTDDESVNLRKTKGAALDMAVKLIGVHYDKVAPTITPSEVEWKWKVDLDHYPFDLSGRVDIIDGTVIHETKTSKYKPNEYSPQSLQCKTYCMARTIVAGKRPSKASADYLVKYKTPVAMTESCRPKVSWDRDVMARVEAAIRLIEAVKAGHQAFAPANPDAWWCAATYCGFAHDCKYWSGRK